MNVLDKLFSNSTTKTLLSNPNFDTYSTETDTPKNEY